METNLIASAPNINGNIGSCTTQLISVTSGRESAWKLRKQDIVTNSCTGEVSRYDYYEYAPTLFIGIGISVAAALLLVCAIVGIFTD